MGQAENTGGFIRKLWAADLPRFRTHLLRLDPDARRMRFGMNADDAFIERYADTAFALEAVLFGYFEGGVLRAAAELRPLAGKEAEAAFSVEAACRDRGVGTALLARLIVTARNRRVQRLYMSCLASNRRMQALARKFEADLVFDAGDAMGVIQAPGRTPGTAMTEAFEDARGFATAVLDLQSRWFDAVLRAGRA